MCDVGRGNLVISKLLALNKFGPFLQSTYYWMSCYTFLGGGALLTSVYVEFCKFGINSAKKIVFSEKTFRKHKIIFLIAPNEIVDPGEKNRTPHGEQRNCY